MAAILLREDGAAPKRTMVFISNIPSGLLAREEDSTAAALRNGGAPGAAGRVRDPRYERLRRLISDHTTGLMQLIHLEDTAAPYALALFADEADAIAACKLAGIASPLPEDTGKAPLSIRLLRTTRRSAADEVYRDTITIDGEAVDKEELVTSLGLLEAYRGMSVAKWCTHTAQEKDCPLGQLCKRIHKKRFQVTLKRRRVDEDVPHNDAADALPRDVLPLCLQTGNWEDLIVPESLRIARSGLSEAGGVAGVGHGSGRQCLSLLRVDVRAAIEALRANSAPDSNNAAQLLELPAIRKFVVAFKASFQAPHLSEASSSSSWFVKLQHPGVAHQRASSSFVAPWDWALHDTTVGIPTLRSVCPLPSNGMPTPLERDRYLELLLDTVNRVSNRFVLDGRDASGVSKLALDMLRALASSPKTFAATFSSSVDDDDADGRIVVVVEPWLRIPSVLHESVMMFRDGRLRSILQRRGNVRYCTRDDGRQTALKHLEVPLRAAASAMCARIAQASGEGVPLDERLSSMSVAVRCVCVPQQGGDDNGGAHNQPCRVAVLSIASYSQEADNSAIFLEFDPNEDAASKPIFNFTKHFTYRLFDRDVLAALGEGKHATVAS